MNRRERVLAAVDHREPDRLPVGFKASEDVIARLAEHYGRDIDIGRRGLPNLLEVLPVDTFGVFNNSHVGVYPRYVGGPEKVLFPETRADGTWDTIFGYTRKWISAAGWRNAEVVTNPLKDAETPADLAAYSWPRADWFDYSRIGDQCREASDFAIVFLAGSLGQTAHLIGIQRYYTELALNPPFIHDCFDRLCEFFTELTERTLKAADGRIDIICVQDDFGSQTGPLISPVMYRNFFKPFHRRIFDAARRYGARVMMHSCGAVREFIAEFLDIGVDILDPVQTTAAQMDPSGLKREFGRDLCFHGGIDTQGTLVRGSPAEVKAEMDGLVDTFHRNGGFILAPSHYIQADAPWENILTVFEHAADLRC